MIFPDYRPRRLRQNELFRALVRETRLSSSQFIYPLFVKHRQRGKGGDLVHARRLPSVG